MDPATRSPSILPKSEEITGPVPIAVPPKPPTPPSTPPLVATATPISKRGRRKKDTEDGQPVEAVEKGRSTPGSLSFPFNLLEAVGTLMSDSVTGDSRAQAILILLATLALGVLWLFLLLRRLGSLEARLLGAQEAHAKCSANESGSAWSGDAEAITRQLGEIQGGVDFLRGYVQKALPLGRAPE